MRRVVLIVLLALAAMGLASAAQGEEPRNLYSPIVMANAPAAGPAVEFVADLPMPFAVLNGVEPSAQQDSSGLWFIGVYRIDAPAGAWVVTWREGDKEVKPLAGVLAGLPAVSAAGSTISNGRGLLALSHSRQQLYFFGWQGESRSPVLRVARVAAFAP